MNIRILSRLVERLSAEMAKVLRLTDWSENTNIIKRGIVIGYHYNLFQNEFMFGLIFLITFQKAPDNISV